MIYQHHNTDPGNPASLPIKYIKTVLHIFHLEDPNNPGTVHPTDPWNYTEDHIDLMGVYFYSLWVNGKKMLTKRLAAIK